jgi:hypothetical protein
MQFKMPEKRNIKTREEVLVRSTRRRTVNRPRGTFAHFLDALLSYDFAYFHRLDSGFTVYKEVLAQELLIKPRQLSRLLSGQVLPESRLLERLAKRFPHIRTEGWITRLEWDCIVQEMELLPARSVISIFVGHLSADDVDRLRPKVIKSIASLIMGHRKCRCAYVLAPMSARLKTRELDPIQLIDRLRLRVLSGWLDANPEAKWDTSIKTRIAQRLMIFQTRTSEEAAHFWCRLPRYLVASNLLADPQSVFFENQFSAVSDSGSVPYPPCRENPDQHVPEPVTSGGWSYWDRNYDAEFREMFAKMAEANLLVNPEHKNLKFPRPI